MRLEELKYSADYIAYTDGSCNNFSPFGEGGCAYVVLDYTRQITMDYQTQSLLGTTNNRAELRAILMALQFIPDGGSVIILTDSQYSINALKSNKTPEKNGDIIKSCKVEMQRIGDVYFQWIKGHNGEYYNEYVDRASMAALNSVRGKFQIPYFDCRYKKDNLNEKDKARVARFTEWMESVAAWKYRDDIPFQLEAQAQAPANP